MRIAFLSREGDGADTAWRLEQEGHEVRFWVEDEYYKDTYKGLLNNRVSSYQEAAKDADFVYFDATKLGHVWEKLPKDIPKLNGSPFADKLEHDRAAGHALMEKAGLAKIESLSFPDYAAAIKHLKEHHERHVVKPHGPEISSEHVIIGEEEDGADAVALLERMQKSGLKLDKPMEVEQRKMGVECAVTVLLNGKDGVVGDRVFVNFEHKRFAAGNDGDGLGYLTGEMGEAALWVRPEKTHLFTDALAKVLPFFQKEDYRGFLDLSLIANDEGLWPMEFTPRPGYPPIFLMTELWGMPLGEFFAAVARGEKADMKVSDDWALGLAVVTPGFPVPEVVEKKSLGLPVFGVTPRNRKHVHFFDVEAGEVNGEDGLVTGKGTGYPFVLTEAAPTLRGAQRRLYRLANQRLAGNPSVTNSWYRPDIGDRVLRDREEIIELGILPEEALRA